MSTPRYAPPEPLSIGAVRVGFPVVLAPMAGVTDWATRSMCRDFGAGLTFTEVVNASALVHDSRRTYDMLHTASGEHPVVAHLYGSDPQIMAAAAARVDALKCFEAIDINCGCPVRRIVARGAGAALMREPRKVEAMVAAVREATSLPVTVKTRSGFTPGHEDVMDMLLAAEAGGASALCVHARFAVARHRGPADWALLARVKQRARIPVIGNGGIDRPADAPRMIRETGVDGVMIGRAAIGAPWIFSQVRDAWQGKSPWQPDYPEQRRVIETHLKRMVDLKNRHESRNKSARYTDEEAAVLMFRVHLAHYLRGWRNWQDVRRRLNEMRSVEQVLAAIEMLMDRQPRLAHHSS